MRQCQSPSFPRRTDGGDCGGCASDALDGRYALQGRSSPLIVIAGEEYGTGTARDWAAKATRLLGVRAVIAQSFERIHRSNLVGMGVLPCQFVPGENAASWKLPGEEEFDLIGFEDARPRQALTLVVHRKSGIIDRIPLVLRLDTPIEIEFARQGGIMPYVLSELVAEARGLP